MKISTLIRSAVLLLALVAGPAQAQGFATANVQVLQGFKMDDYLLGNATESENQNTLTFNYFGTHDYGDVLFFADLSRGSFVDGNDSHVYAEFQPRFMFGKLFGLEKPLVPFFKDVGVATEINQGGTGYYGYLAGLGGDFALPGPFVAGMNLYYKYDKFALHTWQATFYWGLPFKAGPTTVLLAGFADFSGVKDFSGDRGLDLITQPQLLVDVGAFAGKPGKLWAGMEYYVHVHPEETFSSPQAMLQWTMR